MNTTTPRPTPETNLFMDSLHGYSASWEQFAQKVEDFARKLERERDENREWALGTERERNEMIDQLKAMREAIREVFNSFADEDSAWLLDDQQTAALAKLQPFIKP